MDEAYPLSAEEVAKAALEANSRPAPVDPVLTDVAALTARLEYLENVVKEMAVMHERCSKYFDGILEGRV